MGSSACSQSRREFPVKLTEPLTAILYITEDKQHMEDIHHAIHVKEVVEGNLDIYLYIYTQLQLINN